MGTSRARERAMHVVGPELAGGVDAVRDHHHRPPALAVAGQVARGVVEGVVQRGGAEGLELAEARAGCASWSVVKGTTPQYRWSKPARATSSSGCSAARIWVTAMRALVVFSCRVMLPLASTSSEQARGQALRLRRSARAAAAGRPRRRGTPSRPQVRHRPPLAVDGGGGEDHEVRAAGEARHLRPPRAARRGRRGRQRRPRADGASERHVIDFNIDSARAGRR